MNEQTKLAIGMFFCGVLVGVSFTLSFPKTSPSVHDDTILVYKCDEKDGQVVWKPGEYYMGGNMCADLKTSSEPTRICYKTGNATSTISDGLSGKAGWKKVDCVKETPRE